MEVLRTLLFKSEQRLTKTFKDGGAILNIRKMFEYRIKWCKLNRLNLLTTLFEKGVPTGLFGCHQVEDAGRSILGS